LYAEGPEHEHSQSHSNEAGSNPAIIQHALRKGNGLEQLESKLERVDTQGWQCRVTTADDFDSDESVQSAASGRAMHDFLFVKSRDS
jgi:hypothetical protein